MKMGKFFWGVIIILIGIILLGINLGWWNGNIWSILWSYWPIILIAVGLRFFIQNDTVYGSVILLLILGFVLFLATNNSHNSRIKFPQIYKNDNLKTENFSSEKSAVKEADYKINLGAVKVSISALGANSNYLYNGSFAETPGLQVSEKNINESKSVSFEETFKGFPRGHISNRSFNLEVAPNVISDFALNTGASDLDLDFTDVILKKLSIDSGASNGNIKIGRKSDEAEVSIETGASSFNLRVPSDYSLYILSDSALSSRNFDDLGLEKDGKVYKSTDFETASKKLKIEFKAGVSSIKIDRY